MSGVNSGWKSCILSALLVTSVAAGLLLWPASTPGVMAAGPDEEIVYIDDAGVIRVLDTHRVDVRPPVTWFSPEGDWRSFSLGDFNNDGDFEIVAVGGEGFDGKLAVYDPVVAKDGDTKPHIDGIPWDTLFRTTLSGRPDLVAAGNFATGVAGHEIVYGYELTQADKNLTGDNYRLVVLQATNASAPDGRSWTNLVGRRDSSERWSRIAAGDFDNRDPENIAVVDEASGKMHVLRIDGDRLISIAEHDDSLTSKWRDVAIGRYVLGGQAELAAVRQAPLNLASFWVFHYLQAEDDLGDTAWEIFDPSPRVVFMGDVNGSGDDEVLLLRNVPPSVTDRPRLIMRNHGNDSAAVFELILDSDNGYRGGAAGDVDGDGKDNVVVIRNNNVAVFLEPDVSAKQNNYPLTTNRRTVALADLDRIGFDVNALLSADPNPLNATIQLSDKQRSFPIRLTNAGTDGQIAFTAAVVEGADWAKMTQVVATTPATLTVTLDVTSLPPGDYTGEIRVTSSAANVANLPYSIDLALTVTATLLTDPAKLLFNFYPCDDQLAPMTQEIKISGPVGLNYQVQEEAGWITVNPTAGSPPNTLAVTVDPTKRSANFDSALLKLMVDSSGDGVPEPHGIAQVEFICANGQLFLPLVMR